MTPPSPAYRCCIFLDRVVSFIGCVSVYNPRLVNSLPLNHVYLHSVTIIVLANHLLFILRNFPNLYTVTSILLSVYLVLSFNVFSQNVYSVPHAPLMDAPCPSIKDTYHNVTHNPSDFKELIPEFYDTSGGGSGFLQCGEDVSYGTRQCGTPVGDVALPPWASSESFFVTWGKGQVSL